MGETITLEGMRDGVVRLLEDRLVLIGTIRTSMGVSDKDVKKEVLYDSIPDLPVEPEGTYAQKRYPIYVPNVDRTVVFGLSWHRDRDSGPSEETLHGPFLARETKEGIGDILRRIQEYDQKHGEPPGYDPLNPLDD